MGVLVLGVERGILKRKKLESKSIELCVEGSDSSRIGVYSEFLFLIFSFMIIGKVI